MNDADKSLGDIVQDVSEKASLLVREEIELAKAEVTQKATKLAKGAGVGAAAGIFLVFFVIFILHTIAWVLNDLFDSTWLGFLIVSGVLLVLGIIAGLLAMKWIKGGSPPTPDLAIEEAKRTRAEFEHQKIERDQLERSLERQRELSS